jgi:ATP-binding cassette subfamily B protein
MKWRTTFIIAHRLSTIRDADRICVFKDGKIIEEGNYKELIKKWWYFSNLVKSQIKWFID